MRRTSGNGNGASLVREAYPENILFEKKEGVYYLRGKDLAQVKNVLGLECEGNASLGFVEMSLSVYLKQLLDKGLQVGIR